MNKKQSSIFFWTKKIDNLIQCIHEVNGVHFLFDLNQNYYLWARFQ